MATAIRTTHKSERKPKPAGNRWLLLGFVVAVYAALVAAAFTLVWDEYPELLQKERELARRLGAGDRIYCYPPGERGSFYGPHGIVLEAQLCPTSARRWL